MIYKMIDLLMNLFIYVSLVLFNTTFALIGYLDIYAISLVLYMT